VRFVTSFNKDMMNRNTAYLIWLTRTRTIWQITGKGVIRRVQTRLRVFPVTWQRWWSDHAIGRGRKNHAVRKLHGSVFPGTGVIVNWSYTLRK